MKVCLCPLLPPLDLGQPGKKVQSCSYLCLSFVHIYKAIQWIVRGQAAVQRGAASVYIHSYPEHLAYIRVYTRWQRL